MENNCNGKRKEQIESKKKIKFIYEMKNKNEKNKNEIKKID